MKKTLLLSAIFLALLSVLRPMKTNAQVTAVSVGVFDSLVTHCYIPAVDPINIYCSLTGTVTPTTDTATIYVNYGDGTDTTFNMPAPGSTGYASLYLTVFHTYGLPGTYAPYVTVTAMSGVSGSASDAVFTLSNTCGTMNGHMYVDVNTDCINDAGDVALAYFPIFAVNAAVTPADTIFCGWTDDTGYYSFNIPGGTYTLLSNPYSYWGYWWGSYGGDIAPSCPAGGTYSLTVTSGTTYTEDFGYNCTTPTEYDVVAGGWNDWLVRGDTCWAAAYVGDWWWYTDYTCESLSSVVTMTLDPHVHYAGAVPGYTAPTSVSGSTVTWDISTTSDVFDFFSYIYVYVDTFTTVGDTLCSTISATPTSLTDPDLTNNTVSACGVVRASWDPNGLAVSPQGYGTPGYIANKTALSYQIHFQNTGSAPAQNITVVDTLSSNVDMATLHVLKSSAPVDILVNGNIVKFRFGNINLPDSVSNPAGSVGTIVFGVSPKQGLAPGTQIRNQSSIYFDYNVPVQTNAVLNTIEFAPEAVHQVKNATMSATVYPNPAGDEVYAKTSDNSDFTMTVVDMIGRTVATEKSANGKATANTQHLPTGLYIVNLTNGAGKVLTTKVTVQH